MNESITYHREGDYLIPDLLPPKSPRIGVWGMRRQNYLLKNKRPIYTGLLLSGKLNAHLEEIDRSAAELFELIMKRYAEREGITEELKVENQMEWVWQINNIRERVEENIRNELINI